MQSTEGTIPHGLCPSPAYFQHNVHREIGSAGGVERGAAPSTSYLPLTPRSIGALHQRGPLTPELQKRLSLYREMRGSESLPAAPVAPHVSGVNTRVPALSCSSTHRLHAGCAAEGIQTLIRTIFTEWTSQTAIHPILHRIDPRHTCASAQDAT